MILTTERLRVMRDHYKAFGDEVSVLLTLALNELLEYREAEEESAERIDTCAIRPRTPLEIETGRKERVQ